MHALRLHEINSPESIAFEEAPPPSLGIGDVLVRVHAAKFHPDRAVLALYVGRPQWPRSATGHSRP